MRNAEQIITIISAAFGDELFRSATSEDACTSTNTEVQDLACRWHQIVESAKLVGTSGGAAPVWVSQISKVCSSPLAVSGHHR